MVGEYSVPIAPMMKSPILLVLLNTQDMKEFLNKAASRE